MLLAFLSVSVNGAEVKLTKEKATLKFNVPPVVELIPAEATYKIIYPRQLNYYNESKFSDYTRGFSDVDGLVRSRSRMLLAKKILGNVPTDYTFEIVTNGITKIERIGAPYTSSNFQSGYVQDFQYYVLCKLRIFKKDQLVSEYIIDDEETPHKVTLFKNYRIEPSNFQMPYEGYANVESLENDVKKDSPSLSRFYFITEYLQYKELYEKACGVILNLYGDCRFKMSYPVGMVHQKDTGSYADLNVQSTTLLNTLNGITTFESISENASTFKTIAEYFEQLAQKKDIDNDFKSMCLKNAAVAHIMLGDVNRTYELVKEHDNIGFRMLGSLRSIIFDLFNVFSSRSYYQSIDIKQMVESVTLNDYFDRELADFIMVEQQKDAARQLQHEQSVMLEQALNNAEIARLKKEEGAKHETRMIREEHGVIYYTNGTYRNCFVSIPFYNLDVNAVNDKISGKRFFTVRANPIPKRNYIDDVDRIEVTPKNKPSVTFGNIKIIDNSVFNVGTLCEYKFTTLGFRIYVDRTAHENDAFIIVPASNNPKQKGFRLAQIINKKVYLGWIVNNPKIREALDKGLISYNETGVRMLCDMLQSEKLPAKDL